MPTKLIERLLFEEGGNCFFCQRTLSPADATVEHLVARAHGGGNDQENTVACCKTLNALLGHKSLKEKLRVVLNQKGQFRCPKDDDAATSTAGHQTDAQRLKKVVADFRKRGPALPQSPKALRSTINALFQKKLSDEEIASLIGKLEAQRVISIRDKKISYALPPSII